MSNKFVFIFFSESRKERQNRLNRGSGNRKAVYEEAGYWNLEISFPQVRSKG